MDGYREMDEWIDGWIVGWIVGWMDWMEGCRDGHTLNVL